MTTTSTIAFHHHRHCPPPLWAHPAPSCRRSLARTCSARSSRACSPAVLWSTYSPFPPPPPPPPHRRRGRGASVADDDDDDDDDEREREHENGPTTTTNAKSSTTGTANQRRREAVLDVVRDPGFHNKSRSRRLFGMMMTALARVVEGEGYLLPPNDDDNEGGMEDAADDDNDDHVAATAATTAAAEAEEAVRFLGCCAHLVEAYLQGMLSKQKKHRGGG